MDREAWDERYRDAELLWTAEPNRFLVEEVADLEPGRALDLAAGEGRNAVWLGARGWRVLAVDFSAVAIAKGRELARARSVEVEWLVADVLEWRPPADAFDLVLLLYLHLPEVAMAAVVANAVRAVAPGGTLLLVGHDRANLERGHGGPQNPAVLYSAADIVPLLTGLEVVAAETREREVATDDGAATALDVVVRARRPEER